MWLMFTGALLAGNDMNPVGNIRGVSSLHGDGVSNYTSADLGDGTRLLVDMRFGALDKGSWSWNTATAISTESETYSDGAKFNRTAVATSWRIFYERTYGLLFNVNKYLTHEYTAVDGAVYDIPSDFGVGLGFVYRQAMNFAWELQFSNSQSLTVGQNWRNGWSWVLRWHFLY
jgi:hypothetical protein